jgi:hypothetical protein
MFLESTFGKKLTDRTTTPSTWDLNNSITQLDTLDRIPTADMSIFSISEPVTHTSSHIAFLSTSKIAITALTTLLLIAAITTLGTTSYFYSYRINTISEGDYGESCLNKVCNENKLLKCIDQICQCETTSFYWNKAKSKCQDIPFNIRYHGNLCQIGYTQCLNNTKCINSICQCDSDTSYWNGSTCLAKKIYQSTCQIRQTQTAYPLNDPINCISVSECTECLTNSLLYCNSTCSCPNSDYYFDISLGKCVQMKSYFKTCSNSFECDSTIGLFCQNTIGNLTSSCPTTSQLDHCDCAYGQYFEYLYLKCMPKKGYMRPCTQSCECDDLYKGLQCYSGTCSCPPNTFYNNSVCTVARLNSFLSSCNYNSECKSEIGLVCRNTTVCDCLNPSRYYWSIRMSMCVECPDGWIILRTSTAVSRCYYLSTINDTNWNTAVTRCTNDQATLLEIVDTFEYAAIYNYMIAQTFTRWYWIGISSTVFTSSYNSYYFFWISGNYIGYYYQFGNGIVPPYVYRYNGSALNYVALKTGLNSFFVSTYYQGNLNYFICKKDLV